MASTQSVIDAWETKIGIKGEFRIEEVTDVNDETVYHLISRNGSVTAAARSLEKLEAHAGEPFVEGLADTDFKDDPIELDNSDVKKAWNQESTVTRDQLNEVTPDEPTAEEAERLRTGSGLELSGNDQGETAPQGTPVDEHVENRSESTVDETEVDEQTEGEGRVDSSEE